MLIMFNAPKAQDIVSLLASVIALLVCQFLFRETLDIKNLAKRNLVVFTDFGLRDQEVNYSDMKSNSSAQFTKS